VHGRARGRGWWGQGLAGDGWRVRQDWCADNMNRGGDGWRVRHAGRKTHAGAAGTR
jgi:hypothetical protein